MSRLAQWRYRRETKRLIREWNENGRKLMLLPPTTTEQQNAELRRLLRYAEDALRRIADPTEMSGSGELESMTGPAACELRCRMHHAAEALYWLEPRVTIQPSPGAADSE